MTWSDLPFRPTPRVLRQFAGAWLVFFLAMAVHQKLFRGHSAAGQLLGAVALVGVVGLIKPSLVRWLFIAATVLAFPVGWLVTRVVLGLMFFVVLTPVALFFRWRGRDELRLRPRPEGAGYWIERSPPPKAGRYLKQY